MENEIIKKRQETDDDTVFQLRIRGSGLLTRTLSVKYKFYSEKESGWFTGYVYTVTWWTTE